MAMLKKRILIKALIHELPKLIHIGRKDGKYYYSQELLMNELTKLYGQLGLYDNVMDRIKLGGII